MPETKMTPDRGTILDHLNHITRRWHELDEPCLIETVFLTNGDRAEVKNVSHFRFPDQIEDAADHIEGMNPHKLNAYVTVNPVSATNRPGSGRRASAEHIIASFFQWADGDTDEAARNIKKIVGPKPSLVVITGTTPFPRPHVYWELEEPTRNFEAWGTTQRAIAATLKTDASVIDPPRIMRVAGTINWPKPKKEAKGYVAEVTKLIVHDPDDRPPVTSERMSRAFAGQNTGAEPAGFHIDTGNPPPSLDREQVRIQAMSGQDWHHAVVRLVGSYVSRGFTDDEIHRQTDPLTLAGYTVEETRREVQVAIDGARRKGWTPETYADPAALQGAEAQSFDAQKRPLGLEWYRDIQPALTDSYIVKGILAQGSMSVVYGPSNSGKTFFALDLAFAISAGLEWRGHRVAQAAVLYLAAEGGRGVVNRLAALRVTHGPADLPFSLKRAGLDLLHDQADLQHVYDLARAVQADREGLPLVIVIDTLSRIMAGGDENSAADMTALIKNIDAIREATGAHVMLVHHTGKDTARGARGHSSLRAATDTEIEVQTAEDEEGAQARAAMVTKQRDYPGGETFAFTLRSVSLGVDQDGDEVTSCVVVDADAGDFHAAKKSKKGLGGNQKIIADTFDQLLGEGYGKPNPGGVGFPDQGRFWCVPLDELRTHAMGKMAASNKRGAFLEAFKALSEARGLFCVASDLVWRTDRKANG